VFDKVLQSGYFSTFALVFLHTHSTSRVPRRLDIIFLKVWRQGEGSAVWLGGVVTGVEKGGEGGKGRRGGGVLERAGGQCLLSFCSDLTD
jgi:hypothetical protein